MLQLICCLLANAVCAEFSDDIVYVHEWGVILLDGSYLRAAGCPGGYIDEYGCFQEYPMAEVTAPVVYFYGGECFGDFTVSTGAGSFTLMDPPPDTLVSRSDPERMEMAVWEGIIVKHEDPEARQSSEAAIMPPAGQWMDCFSWAAPFWRLPPANLIFHPASGYNDEFIYYESSIDDPEMFLGEYYDYSGEALVFLADDGEMVCVKMTVPGECDASGRTLSDLEILTVIGSWGNGGMLPEEVYGLWRTWKPLLKTRCEGECLILMLFPLTDRQENTVSHLSFVPVENLRVEYERLLLGLGYI
ncbi:MAG: hypothetical protein JXA64_04285 [Candidatus Fermentibacteraceae bacterium]|nr:hypothetical protein [Candidatus Fermentibacteraceae bacterium]MBN2608311.1 hypothetical protein [Candidatus Fermentibacteraceae bacterium]